MNNIFISSTCFDLIDVRAELEVLLIENGMIPILSDSINSHFKVNSNQNSIETCLSNVRNCDIFLIILSKRYGGSLKKAGFSDKSATHLEYEEAVKNKKPIYMYVRDRLEAENSIWSKSKNPKLLSWVKEKDVKIFDIIKAHKKLENNKKNNWFWTFKNIVDLKKRISIDLSSIITQAIITSKLKTRNIPAFIVQSYKVSDLNRANDRYQISVKVINAGDSVAINPIASIVNHFNKTKKNPVKNFTSMRLNSIKPLEEITIEMLMTLKNSAPKAGTFNFSISYITAEGLKIADINNLAYDHCGKKNQLRGSTPTYKGKVYYHDKSIEILTKKNF